MDDHMHKCKVCSTNFDDESINDPKYSSKNCRRRSKRVRKSTPLSSISDVAYCLMMMSRDKWSNQKITSKYGCHTCGRVFSSYQALGGHRASHKKNKLNSGGSTATTMTTEEEEKIHECPFCDRVFASGQALGGHKRSHFTSIKQISRNCENLGIDLNLPAPIDDDISH